MTARTRLSHRPEQDTLDLILKPIFGRRLTKAVQEEEVLVHHPEVAKTPFGASIDNYYEIQQYDFIREIPGRVTKLCVDLHGTWHEKHHVQNWDINKRFALEYCGYHYVELRNYTLHEEVPALYEATDIHQKLSAKSIHLKDESHFEGLMRKFESTMEQATKEVLAQLSLQLLIHRPRLVDN